LNSDPAHPLTTHPEEGLQADIVVVTGTVQVVVQDAVKCQLCRILALQHPPSLGVG